MDNVTYFYLDKLYNSDRIKDLVSFYEKLRDINDALEWVKRRPRLSHVFMRCLAILRLWLSCLLQIMMVFMPGILRKYLGAST